jgi:NADH:ubiquinone oxidoreductase subunit 4 (subunit M)
LKDLHRSEYWQLVPMVIFIVWIGVYPSTFMSKSELYVQTLIGKVEKKVFGTSKYPLIKAATSVESGTSHEVHGGH